MMTKNTDDKPTSIKFRFNLKKKGSIMSEELAAQNENTALDFGDFGGLGKEDVKPGDLATPYIQLMQAGSKWEQANAEAKAGDLRNSVTGDIYPSSQVAEKPGIVFAPVKIVTMYVEAVPYEKGGEYINSHYPESDFVKNAIAASENGGFGKISCAGGEH